LCTKGNLDFLNGEGTTPQEVCVVRRNGWTDIPIIK
jgi:hypothetical protein